MTFAQFKASGRNTADIGEVLRDEVLTGIGGRLYCNDILYIVGDDASEWSTVIGNRFFRSPKLEDIERELYEFAISEGVTL